MTVRATGINPAMLRWARERAGYSAEDIARRRRVPLERVQEWEAGQSYPTWRQLENLAHDDYHRATAFFFLDAPPPENTVASEFRRLPATMLDGLRPDTLYAVRQARARQGDLALLLGPQGSGERFILRDLPGQVSVYSPRQLAESVRQYLGVSLDTQRAWQSADDALKEWRERIEEVGVWIFKRSFAQKDIAGFCLADDVFPVIYLNNGQAKTRQIFTLFHELAHLLFDFNHLERLDDQYYVSELSGEDRAIEIACNRFAGEFLVPFDDFANATTGQTADGITDEYLASLARRYWVSREVILRKFLDRGWLDRQRYWETVEHWRASQEPSSGSEGNYYNTHGVYLGRKYLRTAFLAFDEGRIDESQLSACLGVKGSSLAGLERYAWR